ncbi:inhibitor of sigma-G Gin [Ammoniphilus oxalaticus]|uniref:Inhibitor of sigma-G Gin n=1 Tax=Ammoniphilus oxalaticus TaxID=66863 RepID=A0A419SGB0_9BACL|nr:sigma factor G inhibitor Gin [Ammoniphilus oxalaticus]RKD22819.1 inhibitor of sigma-G Gin [Ammoniphilus oxalaticus]
MSWPIKGCIVCGDTEQKGITIWQSFICESCEQEMVNTDVRDTKYPFFVEKMKLIWKLDA